MADSDVVVETLRSEVMELKEEVESLRNEIRLIKIKMRDQRSPDEKYRNMIETMISEALDNQCYWKMVRFDPHAEKSPTRGRSKSKSRKSENMDISEDHSNFGSYATGYLSWSDEEDSQDVPDVKPKVIKQETPGSRPRACPASVKARLNVSNSNSTEAKRVVAIKKEPSQGSSDREPGSTRTRRTSSKPTVLQDKFRLTVCKRAVEIGPTPAGREFNVPESSVRAWVKKFKAAGISLERSPSPTTPNDSNDIIVIGDTTMGDDEDDMESESEDVGGKAETVVTITTGGDEEFWGDEGVRHSEEPTSKKVKVDYDSDGSYQPGDEDTPKRRRSPRTASEESKSSSRRSTNGRFGRDRIWGYYKEGDPKPGVKRLPMLCKGCGMVVSGEPARLRRHAQQCEKIKELQRQKADAS